MDVFLTWWTTGRSSASAWEPEALEDTVKTKCSFQVLPGYLGRDERVYRVY